MDQVPQLPLELKINLMNPHLPLKRGDVDHFKINSDNRTFTEEDAFSLNAILVSNGRIVEVHKISIRNKPFLAGELSEVINVTIPSDYFGTELTLKLTGISESIQEYKSQKGKCVFSGITTF